MIPRMGFTLHAEEILTQVPLQVEKGRRREETPLKRKTKPHLSKRREDILALLPILMTRVRSVSDFCLILFLYCILSIFVYCILNNIPYCILSSIMLLTWKLTKVTYYNMFLYSKNRHTTHNLGNLICYKSFLVDLFQKYIFFVN